jgi:hypothetical protein
MKVTLAALCCDMVLVGLLMMLVATLPQQAGVPGWSPAVVRGVR